MTLSEAVNRVFEIGRKIREYYDAEIPKWLPNYPLVGPNDEEPPPPPEEKDLEDFLATLSDDQIYQLTLIMDLGRSRFAVKDLAEHYQGLKETVGDRAYAETLIRWDAINLFDVLTDGLEELRKHKINLDKLPLKKVKARKP